MRHWTGDHTAPGTIHIGVFAANRAPSIPLVKPSCTGTMRGRTSAPASVHAGAAPNRLGFLLLPAPDIGDTRRHPGQFVPRAFRVHGDQDPTLAPAHMRIDAAFPMDMIRR